MSKRKRSPGRPEKPTGEARTKALTVRLTPAEHERLARQANEDSRSISDYLVVQALGHRFG